MGKLLDWLKEHPQLAGASAFLAITVLLAVVLGITMARAGSSLRPLIWFLGFLAIVAGPQGVVHLMDGLLAARENGGSKKVSEKGAVGATEGQTSSAMAIPGLKPVPWETVFGPEFDPDLVTGVKAGFETIFSDAEEAKLSFQATGQTALAARFGSPEDAAAALNRYGAFFQFAQANGSDAMGWTARRFGGEGEWNHVVTAGNELYAWTGSTRESVLAHRVRALGPLVEEADVAGGTAPGGAAGEQGGPSSSVPVSRRLSQNTGAMVAFLVINLVAAVFWFFKGSAWAARERPAPVVEAVAAPALRSRLLALNETNLPVALSRGKDGETLEANWRYADARWFDMMQAHRMKKVHRLVLAFDEKNRTVRVSEYWSAFDASAGADGLKLSWQMSKGIQFFAVEHQRVFGAQLDEKGRPTGELSKAYTFNLQELKGPVIDAVTASGWTWQPVVWNAPSGLRWLTE